MLLPRNGAGNPFVPSDRNDPQRSPWADPGRSRHLPGDPRHRPNPCPWLAGDAEALPAAGRGDPPEHSADPLCQTPPRSWARERSQPGGPCEYVGSTIRLLHPLVRQEPTGEPRSQAGATQFEDERAKGANEQPVAPETAEALVVRDGDTCLHRQD